MKRAYGQKVVFAGMGPVICFPIFRLSTHQDSAALVFSGTETAHASRVADIAQVATHVALLSESFYAATIAGLMLNVAAGSNTVFAVEQAATVVA